MTLVTNHIPSDDIQMMMDVMDAVKGMVLGYRNGLLEEGIPVDFANEMTLYFAKLMVGPSSPESGV